MHDAFNRAYQRSIKKIKTSNSYLLCRLSHDWPVRHVEGRGDRGEGTLTLNTWTQRLEDFRESKRLEFVVLETSKDS